MPSRAAQLADKASAVAFRGDAPLCASKLPAPLRFPLVVILSLSVSSLLYSFAAGYTAGDLGRVSRNLNEWWEVGVLVGWRTAELALGWFGNYDGYDLAALSLLSHGPPLYLLTSFYAVRPGTVAISLLIDSLATYLPFRLLRPLSPAHASSSSSSSVAVPNRDIVTDRPIQAYTTILAASIYSVVLYSAYASYLPVLLVTYFNDIPSIAAAHSATAISLLPLTMVFGIAARSFIFTPVTAAVEQGQAAVEASAFDPVTATLWETLKYNAWGYSPRVKAVLSRTAILMAAVGANTFIQLYMTVRGVEWQGAAGFTAVWVAAAAAVGVSLGAVGAV